MHLKAKLHLAGRIRQHLAIHSVNQLHTVQEDSCLVDDQHLQEAILHLRADPPLRRIEPPAPAIGAKGKPVEEKTDL